MIALVLKVIQNQKSAQQPFARRPATARIFNVGLLAKSLLTVAYFAHPQAGETGGVGPLNISTHANEHDSRTLDQKR